MNMNIMRYSLFSIAAGQKVDHAFVKYFLEMKLCCGTPMFLRSTSKFLQKRKCKIFQRNKFHTCI